MTPPPPWHPHAALSGSSYSAVELDHQNDRVFLLEQRELPVHETYHVYTSTKAVAGAIKTMVVRGAPAIGITAAYGMVLAALEAVSLDSAGYLETMRAAGDVLNASRPTAVNLAWAVKKCLALAEHHAKLDGPARWSEMAALGRQIHVEDVEACRTMGRIGGARLPDRGTILTHCNAGALATGGYGTALGVIRGAIEQGKQLRVLADETRPYLQGARLTAWELHKDGIHVEVLADNMAGWFMKQGEIAAVVVGADRIAKNGDVANKIGTYSVACLAKMHGIPFYVAAPWSTVDLATPDGSKIPIEERSRDEVAKVGGATLIPDGVGARHPAFDVTPAALITAIFTERGAFVPGDIATGGP